MAPSHRESFTEEYSYDAFGKRNITGRDTTPLHASTVGYRGQLHDEATGDIYLRHRNYSPALGRFMTSDPARDGMNWYNYAGNDPVNAWDPMGLYSREMKNGALELLREQRVFLENDSLWRRTMDYDYPFEIARVKAAIEVLEGKRSFFMLKSGEKGGINSENAWLDDVLIYATTAKILRDKDLGAMDALREVYGNTAGEAARKWLYQLGKVGGWTQVAEGEMELYTGKDFFGNDVSVWEATQKIGAGTMQGVMFYYSIKGMAKTGAKTIRNAASKSKEYLKKKAESSGLVHKGANNPPAASQSQLNARTVQAELKESAPKNPLDGTKYTPKVQKQMAPNPKTGLPDRHGFPDIVDNRA